MPEAMYSDFAAYYLAKWRELTEVERRRLGNVRPYGWMKERRREWKRMQKRA